MLKPNSLIIDVAGNSLNATDIEHLTNPAVAGVILFDYNGSTPQDYINICSQIRQIRSDVIIMVDQEGGRVQRLHNGFTILPSAAEIGKIYNNNPEQAKQLAATLGTIIAMECIAVGIDLSLAPVVDLDHQCSEIIGSRSFHADPNITSILANAQITAMRNAGMAAALKHFPGHGAVSADTHLATVVDKRDWQTLQADQDIAPFSNVIKQHPQIAIMPAHIQFPRIDSEPVGFSQHWLQSILRQQLEFTGPIISDDLCMQAAREHADLLTCYQQAIAAGCNWVICTHDQAGLSQLLQTPVDESNTSASTDIDFRTNFYASQQYSWDDLASLPLYDAAKQTLKTVLPNPVEIG